MNVHTTRLRRSLAVLAGLAIAATVSVAAPSAADARPAPAGKTAVHVQKHVPGVTSHVIWDW